MAADRARALRKILFILNGGWGYVEVDYESRTFEQGLNGRFQTDPPCIHFAQYHVACHRAFQRRLKRRGYTGDEV
jgi:hypothetical protein